MLGPWKNEKGEPWTGVSSGKSWKGAFDVDIFIDDDNKPYLYFPGRSTDGIYVAPLDPKDLTSFAAAPKHLFGFQSEHVWERWGENNEYLYTAWIEGPWVFKRNGTYYLEYSASGTQWMSYASGVYTSKSPLGPFTYSPRNPLLRKTSGIVTGPGHGCVVRKAGRQLVGLLHHGHVQSARRPAPGHGPGRLRRPRQHVRPRSH